MCEGPLERGLGVFFSSVNFHLFVADCITEYFIMQSVQLCAIELFHFIGQQRSKPVAASDFILTSPI